MYRNLKLSSTLKNSERYWYRSFEMTDQFLWFQVQMNCNSSVRFIFEHLAWIEHHFLSGIRDSRKAGSLWGLMRGVGGVRKSMHQSWLAKGLGIGSLSWGSKVVKEEILSEEASTLQTGSVAFPPGQCISLQLHPYHRLFD